MNKAKKFLKTKTMFLDHELDVLDEHDVKLPHPVKHTMVEIPDFQIQESEDVDLTLNLRPENLVTISDQRLRKIAKRIDRNTKDLNKKLLESIVPLILSHKASTEYVKAVLQEGFKLDVDFDNGIADALDYVAQLSVLTHCIDTVGLPKAARNKYLDLICEKMADETVKVLVHGNRQASAASGRSQLQAMVVSRSKLKEANLKQGFEFSQIEDMVQNVDQQLSSLERSRGAASVVKSRRG